MAVRSASRTIVRFKPCNHLRHVNAMQAELGPISHVASDGASMGVNLGVGVRVPLTRFSGATFPSFPRKQSRNSIHPNRVICSLGLRLRCPDRISRLHDVALAALRHVRMRGRRTTTPFYSATYAKLLLVFAKMAAAYRYNASRCFLP